MTITTTALWAGIGILIALIGGVNAFFLLKKNIRQDKEDSPLARLRERVKEVEEQIVADADKQLRFLTTKLDNDNKRISALEELSKELKESSRIQMRALLAIAGHLREGNHTDAMLKVEVALQNFLTDN
ncbi:MAG: hypothetical protein LBN00_10005 [Oscillospiraceae bacterium]|nr:hypothetical protein [Oscillospiraceae bacterium]